MIFSYPFGSIITPTTLSWPNTIVSTTGTNPTITYTERTHWRIGGLVFIYIDFTITNNNTGGGVLQLALATNAKHRNTFNGRNLNNSQQVIGSLDSGLNIMKITSPAGAYPGVTGHRYILSGTYEE